MEDWGPDVLLALGYGCSPKRATMTRNTRAVFLGEGNTFVPFTLYLVYFMTKIQAIQHSGKGGALFYVARCSKCTSKLVHFPSLSVVCDFNYL